MRPAAASTKRAVSVAMPESRCRKFSATRSAVSSARARPVTSATVSPASQRAPSPQRTREDRIGVELPEGRLGDPDAGDDQRRLGDDDAARLHRRVHRGRAGDVAAADVLGEGPGDQVAHQLWRRPVRCAHAAPPGAGGGANATVTAKASAGV